MRVGGAAFPKSLRMFPLAASHRYPIDGELKHAPHNQRRCRIQTRNRDHRGAQREQEHSNVDHRRNETCCALDLSDY